MLLKTVFVLLYIERVYTDREREREYKFPMVKEGLFSRYFFTSYASMSLISLIVFPGFLCFAPNRIPTTVQTVCHIEAFHLVVE